MYGRERTPGPLAGSPAETEKEGPRHIPPYSPVQRAEHPVPDLLTGSYTRPKSPIEPELPSDDTFIGYFEKQ